jgi:hypothetical protein
MQTSTVRVIGASLFLLGWLIEAVRSRVVRRRRTRAKQKANV